MNPHVINLLVKGHEEKIKEQDYLEWIFGKYILSAVSVAIDHCFNGKKAKSEYIKEPLMSKVFENDGLTEEEIYERELKKALFAEEMWIKSGKKKGLPETVI